MIPDNTIRHFSQSGILLKLFGRVFVFDYAGPVRRQQSDVLTGSILDPFEIQDEHVTVFVSHGHRDHFNPEIFTWQSHIKSIRYVISNDIMGLPPYVLTVGPGESHDIDGIRVRTYHSTDRGVAFSVFFHDTHVYFAGDHALWSRSDDSDDFRYIRLMNTLLKGTPPMDIAFHVCDPRLSGKGAGGIYAFAQEFQPKILVPIHSFGVYKFNKKAHRELIRLGYSGFFWEIQEFGEELQLAPLLRDVLHPIG